MIPEHERAVLTTDRPTDGLQTGAVGTIVGVYEPFCAYDVEFVSLDGEVSIVVTLPESQVRPVQKGEFPHARHLGTGMVPLAAEVSSELVELGIPAEGLLIREHHEGLMDRVSDCCNSFRGRLVQDEAKEGPVPILGASFWDIRGKYRCDALQFDVVNLADHFAWAIGLASVYLRLVPPNEEVQRQDAAKLLCMYHLDFAMRLASSGWDRISLLLDLAFDLNTRYECSFIRVLREIPNKQPHLASDEDFKWLKQFRDDKFTELEGKKGEGRRHEVTHLLSYRTRFFCESLELQSVKTSGIHLPDKTRLEQERDLLLDHYRLYISGITHATDLIRRVFSQR